MGFPHIRTVKSKIEMAKVKVRGGFAPMSLAYSINPTKSEFLGVLSRWGMDPEGEMVKHKFIRGLAVDNTGDLYAWDPLLVNHRDFSAAFGLDKDGWIPLFLTSDRVFVSPYDFYKDYWPKGCSDSDDVIKYVTNFRALKNIYGNSFLVEEYALY